MVACRDRAGDVVDFSQSTLDGNSHCALVLGKQIENATALSVVKLRPPSSIAENSKWSSASSALTDKRVQRSQPSRPMKGTRMAMFLPLPVNWNVSSTDGRGSRFGAVKHALRQRVADAVGIHIFDVLADAVWAGMYRFPAKRIARAA